MATAPYSPPAIYGFPPLFTLQPADATRAKQLEQWRQLIVGWHQAHRQATMAVREWPLWENKALGRRLPDEAVAVVMAHLVASGSAEWVDAGRTSCRVFYRSPAEWAAKLQAHVEAAAMAANVYTLYELHSGGALYGTDFAGMEPVLLLRALEQLESQGLVELFRTPGGPLDEVGVRFKPR